MAKRPHEHGHGPPNKKHRHGGQNHAAPQQTFDNHSRGSQLSEEAVLPKSDVPKTNVPAYIPFKSATSLPPLPPVSDELSTTPFRHKSIYGYDRSSASDDSTYERLEFLGDAYVELIASRLIFHHFPHLTAGSQSQVRETLVKNETLSQYARAYDFESRLQLAEKDRLLQDARSRGNKGLNKILGDSFEAYVAAVVLSDPENGFAIAEHWLTSLWTPKVIEAARANGHVPASLTPSTEHKDLSSTYNPAAKAELQQKIMGQGIKLEYEPWRASEELKGAKLGQNNHYIALYLTGWGYTRKLLGKGEGKNKVEAGNWAAVQALHGEHKDVVEECAKKLVVIREEKKREKAEEESKTAVLAS